MGCHFLFIILVFATQAFALDKQGTSHKYVSMNGEEDEEMHISGSLSAGSALSNNSYAARPDNSGLALFRYAAHSDFDLIGPKLSIPLDLNMFTDKTAKNTRYFSPSELDVIIGTTSTWRVGEGNLEIGARYENDRPVNSRSTYTQSYADLRARYYAHSTSFTLGWFAFNPTYAARPDNTGLALFRLGAHQEFNLWKEILFFGLDGQSFTDRNRNSGIRPSELDTTISLIYRRTGYEVQVAYENDHPLDRGHYVQDFIYMMVSFPFQALN